MKFLTVLNILVFLFTWNIAQASWFNVNHGEVDQSTTITKNNTITTFVTTSNQLYYFIGSNVQIVTLPDAQTLPQDWWYQFINSTVGEVTVKDYAGNIIGIVDAQRSSTFLLRDRPNAAGVWNQITSAISGSGTVVDFASFSALAPMMYDSMGQFSMPQATAISDGYLSAADFALFSTNSGISQLTGDVVATGPGIAVATIQANVVDNNKLAFMGANTLKGSVAGGSPIDLSSAQATSILNPAVGDSGSGGTKGLVPAPASGDATKCLKGDMTFGTCGAGGGDVAGPASSTDNAITRFDSTTGKLIQNSVGILNDGGDLSGIRDLTLTGDTVLDTALNGVVKATSGAIGASAVQNSELAGMAQSTIKGRAASSGTGAPVDLTATQATAILNNFVGDSGSGGTKGLVLAPAAGDAAAGKFLKADGTWVAPTGSGDVVGPASSVDNEITLFSGTTGKLIKRATTTGLLKGTSGVLSAATAGTDYEVPLTFSTGLTRTVNTVTVNASQSISTLSNLTSNGLVTTSGGTGALSVTATTGSGNVVLATSPTIVTPTIAKLANLTTNGFVKTGSSDGTLSVQTSPLPVADTTVANQALTTCSTARTVDWSTGSSFTLLLTNGSTCAITFSNMASGQVVTIDYRQPASTGSALVSYASTVLWAAGAVPVMTTGGNATDTCTYKYNGTDIRGSCVQAFQ